LPNETPGEIARFLTANSHINGQVSLLFQDLPDETPGEIPFSQLTAINGQVSLLFQGLSDETPGEIYSALSHS